MPGKARWQTITPVFSKCYAGFHHDNHQSGDIHGPGKIQQISLPMQKKIFEDHFIWGKKQVLLPREWICIYNSLQKIPAENLSHMKHPLQVETEEESKTQWMSLSGERIQSQGQELRWTMSVHLFSVAIVPVFLSWQETVSKIHWPLSALRTSRSRAMSTSWADITIYSGKVKGRGRKPTAQCWLPPNLPSRPEPSLAPTQPPCVCSLGWLILGLSTQHKQLPTCQFYLSF